ncbi:MAG: hypothetical protein Q8J74_05910 [Candidatus Didemnitutus sp.]|nr:hypothetical protein [Candidatus Didemnitutus sp.]
MRSTDPLFTVRPHRGGFLAKTLLFFGLVVGGFALAWVLLLPKIVASVVRSKTGFELTINELSVNPLTAKVRLAGLVVKNPPGWTETAFLNLRALRADAELMSLFKGRLIADEIVVDVTHVTLVKNSEGIFNILVFQEGLTGPASPAGAGSPKPETGKSPEFLIRRLMVKFDRLTYADHSGRKPVVREYNLAINRELRDVDSVAALVSPFQGAALSVVSDAVGGMFQDATQLLQNSGDLVKDAGGTLKETGKKAGDTLKGLMQSLDKKKP